MTSSLIVVLLPLCLSKRMLKGGISTDIVRTNTDLNEDQYALLEQRNLLLLIKEGFELTTLQQEMLSE